MEPRITHATAVGGFRVALAFADGTQGVVDLTSRIGGRGGGLAQWGGPGSGDAA